TSRHVRICLIRMPAWRWIGLPFRTTCSAVVGNTACSGRAMLLLRFRPVISRFAHLVNPGRLDKPPGPGTRWGCLKSLSAHAPWGNYSPEAQNLAALFSSGAENVLSSTEGDGAPVNKGTAHESKKNGRADLPALPRWPLLRGRRYLEVLDRLAILVRE